MTSALWLRAARRWWKGKQECAILWLLRQTCSWSHSLLLNLRSYCEIYPAWKVIRGGKSPRKKNPGQFWEQERQQSLGFCRFFSTWWPSAFYCNNPSHCSSLCALCYLILLSFYIYAYCLPHIQLNSYGIISKKRKTQSLSRGKKTKILTVKQPKEYPCVFPKTPNLFPVPSHITCDCSCHPASCAAQHHAHVGCHNKKPVRMEICQVSLSQ